MNIDDCAKIVGDEWLESDLDIEVNTVELGLYLAIVYDRDVLEEMGLGDVTSTRVSQNGRKPGITTPEVLTRGPKVIPNISFILQYLSVWYHCIIFLLCCIEA